MWKNKWPGKGPLIFVESLMERHGSPGDVHPKRLAPGKTGAMSWVVEVDNIDGSIGSYGDSGVLPPTIHEHRFQCRFPLGDWRISFANEECSFM